MNLDIIAQRMRSDPQNQYRVYSKGGRLIARCHTGRGALHVARRGKGRTIIARRKGRAFIRWVDQFPEGEEA